MFENLWIKVWTHFNRQRRKFEACWKCTSKKFDVLEFSCWCKKTEAAISRKSCFFCDVFYRNESAVKVCVSLTTIDGVQSELLGTQDVSFRQKPVGLRSHFIRGRYLLFSTKISGKLDRPIWSWAQTHTSRFGKKRLFFPYHTFCF